MMMGPLVRLSLRSALVLLCALSLYTGALWLLLTHRPHLKSASAGARKLTSPSDNNLTSDDFSQEQPPLQFPTSIPELQVLVAVLQQYRDSHFLYLLTLFSAAYVYKQTFAIPGSALMNVLGGALLGVSVAVPLVCVLTAVGASCCYLLSSLSLAQMLLLYLPHRVHWLRDKLTSSGSSNSSLFLLLVSLRVFPGTPNWFLNVASPVAGVPLRLFFPSVLIGLAPYNSVCVVAGASVSQLHSISELWSGSSLAVLVLLAALAYAGSRIAARRCSSPLSSSSSCPSPPSLNDAREKKD